MEITNLMPLVVGGAVMAVLVYATVTNGRGARYAWLVPASLSAAFLAWTVWAIVREGPTGFWTEHTRNLWGNQIWFDLLFAVSIGWWLMVPRARNAGMKVWVWLLCVIATGSIGFLAMLSRLLYLERGT